MWAPERIEIHRRRPPGSRSRRSARAFGAGRVDHLHAGVAQCPRDDLRPAVVTVEARLGDHDSDLPGHPRWYKKRFDGRRAVEPPSGYRRDYGNEAQGDRLLAGVAQSRRRAVGLPRRGPPGRVLLDCGAGVLAKLPRELEDWPRIDAICLTHFHLDHWGDVVPWVWARWFGPAAEQPGRTCGCRLAASC